MATKQKSTIGCLAFLLVMVAISWGVYECKYQYSYYRDLQDKPWAYSKDKTAKLLIGQWQGSFKDPDNVQKTLSLEVFEPTTDEQRKEKAGKTIRHKRSIGALKKDKTYFYGVATVVSSLGTEAYELYGHVQEEDFHQLSLQFGAKDETQRIVPNFALNLCESGHWQGDELTLNLGFSYFNTTGSSYSDSADPRYEKIVQVNLLRK